jgi:hypothetical protein
MLLQPALPFLAGRSRSKCDEGLGLVLANDDEKVTTHSGHFARQKVSMHHDVDDT